MPFLPMLGLIVGAAGIGLEVASTLERGKREQEALEFNARAQRNEALREEQAAADEAGRFATAGERLQATQRARFAKGGVTAEGTPQLVLAEAAKILTEDVQRILKGGQRRGEALRTGARLSVAQGRTARRASLFEAGTSLLSGTVGVLDRFDRTRV